MWRTGHFVAGIGIRRGKLAEYGQGFRLFEGGRNEPHNPALDLGNSLNNFSVVAEGRGKQDQ
jgi:hypothetical protein